MTDRRDPVDADPPAFCSAPSAPSEDGAPRSSLAPRDPKRGARLRKATRDQLVLGRIDLDAQVADDDLVRSIWAIVQRLDLSALYLPIEARDEVAGAPAIDPELSIPAQALSWDDRNEITQTRRR